jgi:hypothetical protein
LDAIANCLPLIDSEPGQRTMHSSARTARVIEYFALKADAALSRDAAPFLKPLGDLNEVHFLHFWRIFDDAVRFVDGIGKGGEPETGNPAPQDLLAWEVDALRASILSALDSSGCNLLAGSALVDMVREFAVGSVLPTFWEAVELNFGHQDGDDRALGPDELAIVLITCLSDAMCWQHDLAANLRSAMLSTERSLRSSMQLSSTQKYSIAGDLSLADTLDPRQLEVSSDEDYIMASPRSPIQPFAEEESPLPPCWSPPTLSATVELSSSPPAASPKGVGKPHLRTALLLSPGASTKGFLNNTALEEEDAKAATAALGFLRTAMVPEAEPEPPPGPISIQLPSERSPGFAVYLHIYDVSREEGIRRLNTVLAHRRSPLKFGGVFHTGVEVNGKEWSFGFSFQQNVPGVQSGVPKAHPDHTYRQTYQMPWTTQLSPEEITAVIADLREEYPGNDYDILRRNCCHFADDFVQRLGAGRVPGWVCRLARLGAQVDRALQAARGRSWSKQQAFLPGSRGSHSNNSALSRNRLAVTSPTRMSRTVAAVR